MWLVIVLGALLGAALLRAWWMDRTAAKQGRRWMPVKQRGLRRTRFELVDKDQYDEQVRERALADALAERARRRTEEQGFVVPRLSRRSLARRRPRG